MSDDPKLSLCEYRGSTVVIIKHRDRDVQVAFSPKGKSIQVWIDGEKLEPFLNGINGVVKR